MSNSEDITDPATDLQYLFASLRSSTIKKQSTSKNGSTAASSSRQNSSPGVVGIPNSAKPQDAEQHLAAYSSNDSQVFNGLPVKSMSFDLDTSRKAITPTVTGDRSTSNQTATLLNLLTFSAPTLSSDQQPPLPTTQPQTSSSEVVPGMHNMHDRSIPASDLVASLMAKPLTPAPRESQTASSSVNHQDLLLKLLNPTTSQPLVTPTQNAIPTVEARDDHKGIQNTVHTLPDRTLKGESSVAPTNKQDISPSRNDSPIRFFGSNNNNNKEPTPFEPQDLPKVESAPKRESIFTYVNPFEQLAASSPRNIKTQSNNGDGIKRKITEPSLRYPPANSRRKLTPTGSEVLDSIESPTPPVLMDGNTQIEVLMGIGDTSRNATTVAEAVNNVRDRVDKEAESALATAEEKESDLGIKKEAEDALEITLDALEEETREIPVYKEVGVMDDTNKAILEETIPEDEVDAVKDAIDDIDQGNAADDWEDAEPEDVKTENENARVVEVYQFPMKPFVAIDIKPKELPSLIMREESMTNIARLKKEFDQIDRTLTTATNDFIVYGSPKSGGLKVIRQDDGMAKHIFPDTHDRIFNVSISSAHPASPSRGIQNVIATGLSGTVYWATILKPGENIIDHDMKDQCIVFPPSPAYSDNSSSGQLKTRAKKSSRNPEFFAIGRGKSIHIVFPLHARESKFLRENSIIDTENYFKDRNLRICTGKAGKDFTFSEDDSTILTLDKTGRLRFWDVRDLVAEDNGTVSTLAPVEVKTSIMTLITAHPSEKPWPTSVLLVDKLRPYTKGTALRYVIVGMKQNHTLQLWDLCLGKAVQEVNFPHEKESDAICSIAYHPYSGILVVGHPTRNSIYLIHLSAPRYNLPPAISQAKFIQRLANKDSTLPKPEATAILSGLREYSFGNRGNLRSVELVPASGEPTRSIEDDDDPMLFELYVMHSKGVTCLGIRKKDLGWSRDSKVEHPIDAEKEGYIIVNDLKEPHLGALSEPSSTNDIQPTSAATTIAYKSAKNKILLTPSKPYAQVLDAGVQPSLAPNSEKAEKKKKKRTGAATDNSLRKTDIPNVPPLTPAGHESNTHAAHQAPTESIQAIRITEKEASPGMNLDLTPRSAPEFVQKVIDDSSNQPIKNGESVQHSISSDTLDKELKKIEKEISEEFNNVIGRELNSLYQRFAEDKRVQDAAGAAKLDAVLRLVSSTLGDNVEKALSRIITSNIQQTVVPSIADVTSSTVDKRITEVVTQQLHHVIPPLLKLTLPEAISRGVQNPEVLRVIAEQITGKITGHIDKEFSRVLHNTISPSFKNLAISVAQKSMVETENRVREHLKRTEVQHKNDTAKIDQLTALVRGLTETVHSMAAAQSEFQNQILKLQNSGQERQGGPVSAASSQEQNHPSSSLSRLTVKSPEQEELEMISTLMTEGRYEEGIIQVYASVLGLSDFANLIASGYNQNNKQPYSITSLFVVIHRTFNSYRLWSLFL